MSTQTPTDKQVDLLLKSMPEARHADDGELLAFRAGSLHPDAAEELADHLSECAYCGELLAALSDPVPDRVLRDAERHLLGRRVTRERWWRPVAAVVTLAAAALMVWFAFVRTASVDAPPAYTLDGPTGGVQGYRGAAEDEPKREGPPIYQPSGHFRVTLRPAEELTGKAPILAVYVSRPGGPLEAVPAKALTMGPSGAYLVDGRARDLFGEEPGPRTVHFVLTTDPALLGELPGTPAGSARAGSLSRGLAWYTVSVDYRTDFSGE